jgi:hypothetical protein
MVRLEPLDAWEACWAPYDLPTYETALKFIQPNDVVLDIGAGDCSFARRMARVARHVYAVEKQPGLLANQPPWPNNLTPICADARASRWPTDITVGVLLMLHCRHFGFYATRLRVTGCQRLITNARWGMDVELVSLGQRIAWHTASPGWYACMCGAVGFVETGSEKITLAVMDFVNEVETCPQCTETDFCH